jgi:hypothetical protein
MEAKKQSKKDVIKMEVETPMVFHFQRSTDGSDWQRT